MRKTILFIAMSLDGYIADTDGKVDWLTGQDNGADSCDSYTDFVKGIDTVIMGWKTYHQITAELSPGQWVYDNLQSYIITHRKCTSADNIIFTSENPCALVSKLKQHSGKDIWICGGADIVRQLMTANLIDRYHISVIPTILGSGIRLFGTPVQKTDLRLIASKENCGIAELILEKKQ